ncbi:histone-lysine N-methyltransferase SETMAR-like [Octopus bimaculoides]|uniref:histone-lysine N-methyltransferase SETMAR-like n=1 Tax=Octopus bimaculoides TaxID=37653 RepID=UPI00071CE99E|nr:histone-lysine N-methyltransferase SETMAR-like [Octopus bimaculoides]|eukprot:XP_014782746.1 PREDICTED: histone-lysine N-methyltransferase SETMAR-like [Octopus bimaculoides]
MSDYEITNFELRVLLRHYWRNNLDAKAAAKAICDVEGEGTVAPRTAQKWFKRFNKGDFDPEDRPRSGRPAILDEGDLQAVLDVEPSSSTRELAEELSVYQKTIWNNFKPLDFVHKKP